MSITKLSLADKFIEGYVKTPPCLQEQTLTKVAILVCQNTDLKKVILSTTPPAVPPTGNYLDDVLIVWEKPIEEKSKAICETLRMPPRLKSKLILRIWQIALELFSWNKRHQEILGINSETMDQFLLLSDWTVEGRLDEGKIAERLAEDAGIPAWERYQLASLCCMKTYTMPLWLLLTPEVRKNLYSNLRYYNKYYIGSGLIKLWASIFERKENSAYRVENDFWQYGLFEAIAEGATTATVHCWEALTLDKKQEIIVDVALYAHKQSMKKTTRVCWMWSLIWPRKIKRRRSPLFYGEILYFFISHMSEEQKNKFFQLITNKYREVESSFCFKCFIQWPYQDFFLPMISKSWDILIEKHIEEIILMLLYRYTKHKDFPEMESECRDYDYGSLLLELLEQAPEQHKRNFFDSKALYGIRKLFNSLAVKSSIGHRDFEIIRCILHHATVEEKELFMFSDESDICVFLITCENYTLFDFILTEYVPRESRFDFKRRCLNSYKVESLCSDLLIRDDEKPFIVFLNWAFSSEQEIFQFKLKLFAREQFNLVRYVNQKVNNVDKVIRRCLPSERAMRLFQDQWVSENGMDVCCQLIFDSKWDELEEFLRWCYPSDEVLEQFKRDLFQRSANICGILMLKQEWAKIELFFKWYKLSLEDIYLLKKDTVIHCFNVIYSRLNEEKEWEHVTASLIWGLRDKESLIAARKAFKEVDWKSKPFYFGDESHQIIQQRWDQLIEQRLHSIEAKEAIKYKD